MRLTRRGRRVLALLLGLGALVVGALVLRGAARGPTAAEVCATPPAVITRGGVTLTPDAMTAFLRAQRVAGHRIGVVQSFRSCAQQRLACMNVCGSPGGCPGTCAPAGLSWHNRGEAVDLTAAEVKNPAVVGAMEKAGWCQSVPTNDPGHFSFDGCH